MEQLTCLLVIKGLDERRTLAERKAHRTGKPIENTVFPLRHAHTYRGGEPLAALVRRDGVRFRLNC